MFMNLLKLNYETFENSTFFGIHAVDFRFVQ